MFITLKRNVRFTYPLSHYDIDFQSFQSDKFYSVLPEVFTAWGLKNRLNILGTVIFLSLVEALHLRSTKMSS